VFRGRRGYRQGSCPAVSVENAVCLILAVAVVGYLLYTLIRPEKF
jgi:K+-transporting ATPase KdpF subunit